MLCILLRNYVFSGGGYDLGCRPNPLGDFIPKPRLRFAAVIRCVRGIRGRFAT